MNDSDRAQWIDNDEGLYLWWRSSRVSKRNFIRENRQEITDYINRVLSGERQAHYGAYGH
jgi:hypothetical protein